MDNMLLLSLRSILPTLSSDPPEEISQLTQSLYLISKQRIRRLKPEEEVARQYICAHIAAERLAPLYDLLPLNATRPPIPAKKYANILSRFKAVLPANLSDREHRKKTLRFNAGDEESVQSEKHSEEQDPNSQAIVLPESITRYMPTAVIKSACRVFEFSVGMVPYITFILHSMQTDNLSDESIRYLLSAIICVVLEAERKRRLSQQKIKQVCKIVFPLFGVQLNAFKSMYSLDLVSKVHSRLTKAERQKSKSGGELGIAWKNVKDILHSQSRETSSIFTVGGSGSMIRPMLDFGSVRKREQLKAWKSELRKRIDELKSAQTT